MRLYSIILLILVLALIPSCRNSIGEINANISEDTNGKSAKELVTISTPYIESLWQKYYVSEIFMFLNNNLLGDVYITYTDNSKKDLPRLANIQIDTKEKKIVSLYELAREDRAYSGRIHFSEWVIDSTEAFKIAKEIFGKDYFQKVLLHAYLSEGELEIWLVMLQNIDEKISYECRIDPYTGEIIHLATHTW